MGLNSSQVHMNICYELADKVAAQFFSAGLDDLGSINSAFFNKTWSDSDNTEIIIVLQAACDQLVTMHQNLGCIELNTLLSTISELQKYEYYKNATFIFPLAQSDGRAHWTLVTIKNKEASFYDPKRKTFLNTSNLFKRKSSIFHYDLNPIKNAFNCFGFNLKKIHYTELQPFNNTNACGYVIAHIAGQLLKKNPQERSTFTNFQSFNFSEMRDHSSSLKSSYRAIYDAILAKSPGLASEDDALTQVDYSSVWAFPSNQSIASFKDDDAGPELLTARDDDGNEVTQKDVPEGILVSLKQTP